MAKNRLSVPGPSPRKDCHLIVSHDFEPNYVLGFARGLLANGVNFANTSSDETLDRLAAAGVPQYKLRDSLSPDRTKTRKICDLARYYLLLFWITFRHRGRTIHFN